MCFRSLWEIRLESYSPRNVSLPFSDATFCVCCKHKQEIQGVGNSTTIQLTPLLTRVILLVLKLAKQSQSASYGPIHALLLGVQLYARQQNSRCLWLYYAPNDNFIYCLHCFIRTKWASLHHSLQPAAVHNINLLIAMSFQLQWMLQIPVHVYHTSW